MNKLGPDFRQQPQSRGFQNGFFYGGDDYVIYNPYMRPIYPQRDPKTNDLTSPLERADSTEAQVYNNAGNPGNQDKVAKVMREYKAGTLTSRGRKVTSRRQAVAIALSEAGLSRK